MLKIERQREYRMPGREEDKTTDDKDGKTERIKQSYFFLIFISLSPISVVLSHSFSHFLYFSIKSEIRRSRMKIRKKSVSEEIGRQMLGIERRRL